MAEGIFPKVAGDGLYASEVNEFANQQENFIVVATAQPAHYVGSNSSTLQQGINHALASGTALYIRSGNYTIDTPLTIDGHLKVQGAGTEITVLTAASGLNDYMIKINSELNTGSYYRTIIRDLQIDNDAANQSDGGGIISFGGIESVYQNVHFTRPYQYGLFLYNTGSGAGNFGHHNRIHQCLFDQGIQSAGSGGGIYMRFNDENCIIQSEFQYNNTDIQDHTGFTNIIGNAFVAGKKGIYVLDASRARITNNIFDYKGEEGVYCKGAFNVIAQNTFYNCSSGTNNAYSCLKIDWYGTNIVNGNIFMQESTTNKAKAAIEENGNAAEDTYGQNIITDNIIISAGGATSLAGTDNWGTGSIIETNSNTVTDNIYRQ